MNDNFTVCPRCQKDWSSKTTNLMGYETINCRSCQLFYEPDAEVMWIWLSDQHYLAWYFDENECEYASVKYPFIDIELPILPFDFTMETLQTYLVFS